MELQVLPLMSTDSQILITLQECIYFLFFGQIAASRYIDGWGTEAGFLWYINDLDGGIRPLVSFMPFIHHAYEYIGLVVNGLRGANIL